MSNDLVKRLRDRGVCSLAQNSCRNDWVCEQAADRIEQLQSRLYQCASELQIYMDAVADLEAKLKKAVGALEAITFECVGDSARCGSRAALAELKERN